MELKDIFVYEDQDQKKKVSRREQYTLDVIRKSFLELLEKKPIEKITIGELCGIADINRSTFYRHYEDIYALLNSIAEQCHRDLFFNIIDTVEFSERFEETGYNYIRRVCEITEQNKNLYKILLFGKTKTKLLDMLSETTFRLYYLAHERQSGFRDAKEVPIHYRYLVHGILGTWTFWIKCDCTPEKEIIAGVINDQIIGFFHRMHVLYNK